MLEKIFIDALEISLTSGAAILTIILFSKLTENRFRAKWRYWVWALLALRLVLPFNIDMPKAPIKVDVPRREMVITQSPSEEVSPEGGFSAASGENLSTDIFVPPVSEHEAEVLPPRGESSGSPLSTEPKSYSFSLVSVFAVIWLLGAAAAAGWNLFAYFRFVNRSKPWNREPSAEAAKAFAALRAEMGVSKRVRLYENRLIKSPMMVGYFRSAVLLPTAELLPEEYAFILRHELTHYKRRDLWYKFLLMLAAALNWYNPAVWLMCRKAENDIEITCDEAVVKAAGADYRREYCETILRTMRRGQNGPLLLSTGFYGGAKVLKKRFAAVLNPKTHRGVLLFVLAALVIAVSGTLVACNTEKPAAEPVSEPEFEPKSEKEVIEGGKKLVETVFRNMDLFENGDCASLVTDEVAQYIADVTAGKQSDIKKSGESYIDYTLTVELSDSRTLENGIELFFTAAKNYHTETDGIDIGEKKLTKLTYSYDRGLFTRFTIFDIDWTVDEKYYVVFDPESDPRPTVSAPDENGLFPFISDGDWDRWVTYYGRADTEKPAEPISKILECEDYLKYLSETYPDIDDWEVVYETSDYVLTESYDPYSYSFRNMYLPRRFAVLKTEQSRDFDRLFVGTYEYYAAFVSSQNGSGIQPRREFESESFPAFETDVQVGDLSGAETYPSTWSMMAGLWFPDEGKEIVFDWNYNRAIPVYGVTEPMNIHVVQDVKYSCDIDGKKLSFSENRENDMIFFANFKSDASIIYYYDGDTKTLQHFEGISKSNDGFPQIYFIDSETIVIESSGVLRFYRCGEGEDVTKSFAEIGGSGKGLSDGETLSTNFIIEDKSIGGRYAWMYSDLEANEYGICTFDKEGNLLSSFSTGLPGDGTIGSCNFRDGLVYFSYYPSPYSSSRSTNYAVDARPEREHTLQADAW